MNRQARPNRHGRGQRPSHHPVRQQNIRQPKKLPFLDAVCRRLNQRVNYTDERSVLALYERGWIFNGVLGNVEGEEARYVKALASRYQSWVLRQVA